MTQLTYDMARALAKQWAPGDEVVVTRLDHDANIRPWVQAAESVGAVVRWADFDPDTAELSPAHVADQLSDRTRLVAVTGASNLLGTRPTCRQSPRRRTRPALCCTSTACTSCRTPPWTWLRGRRLLRLLAVQVLRAAPRCSRRGSGAARVVQPDKLLPASDAVPERFELGTLPYELLAGVSACVDFIAGLAPAKAPTRAVMASMSAVEAYEEELLAHLSRDSPRWTT
jgi:selenocysteine lyase/cysteine desulfurase